MTPSPEPEPPRLIPPLPERDPELGEIRWEGWEKALALSHIDPSCDTCDHPGPMRTAMGLTLYQEPPRRTLLRRSKITEGRRPVWSEPFVPEPRWVFTHWALRCPRCDEMNVWRTRGWVRIHYHPFAVSRVLPPRDDALF